MAPLFKVHLLTLPFMMFAGAALLLTSCAVPGTSTSSTSSTRATLTGDFPTLNKTSTAFSVRQKYGGSSFRPSANSREVEETTRETFFAWLFSLDEDHPTRKKKKAAAKPTRPVVPAPKIHSAVLAQSNRANTRVVIDVSKQKAFLLVNGKIAIETPVSTARPGKSTPRGTFNMSERVRSGKISTIYGVGMPFWMRLSGSVYGVHAGYLPGYPASAGCIRLPREAAEMIYDNTKYGTRVTIYSAWDGV